MKYLILTITLLGTFIGMSQSTITGRVTDSADKETLPGVNILIKGTDRGTITDIDGGFSLKAKPEDVLVFSFVGYLPQEITIGSKSNIDVKMELDMKSLDEVVVVGYGTTKKSDITGAVSSVRTKDLNPGPVLSVSNYLQNTAPGVVMTQGSAQPGGGFSIKIRGTSSILGGNGPLYVIDGLPITSDDVQPGVTSRYRSSPPKNPLNGINPEDIVSIEILKDASATAIYGARGANGVVLITTKRGEKGKTNIDYSGSVSVQQVAKKYDMLSASQFMKVSNEEFLHQNPTANPLYSPSQINNAGAGTDWVDEVSQMGIINRHQVAMSGATEKLNYYVSGNFYNHRGIVQQSSLDRITGRVNLNYKITKAWSVGMNTVISHVVDHQIPFGATGGGGPEFAGLFDNSRTWSPLVSVRQTDGTYSRHPYVDNIPNPVSLLDVQDQITTNRVLGTVFTEYQIIPGLKAKVNLGFDQSHSEREALIPLTVIRGEQANGEAEFGSTDARNLLSEFTLNYETKLFGNDFSVLGGYTYQQFDNESNRLLLVNFADQTQNIDKITDADTITNQPFKEQSKLLSYLGRINYNVANKYLFTLTFRADGSTKFGTSNKWGYFPSAAVAWKIHEEAFFNSSFIEQLKLRGSYGQIGNQEIGNKRSQALYGITRRTVIGGSPVQGLTPKYPPNPNLKWETTTQLNIGLDMTMMSGRIQTSVDVYRKVTTDVLLNFLLAPTSGYESITSNAGAILNRGIEWAITSHNLTGELDWSTSFNFSYNKNSWQDRAGYYPTGKTVEGEHDVVGGTYGYQVLGIFKTQAEVDASSQPNAKPGMFHFKDVNGDNDITPEDRVLLGKEDPYVSLGLNNSFSYAKFDLNFFFQGMLGREKNNFTLAGLENVQSILRGSNKTVSVLDRWTETNTNGKIHSGALNTDGGDNYLNSVYVEDASFVRLRNVTLGYTTSGSKFIKSFRVYADAQNLLTFTKYKGLDPETSEFLQYPNARTYTLGLNVSF
jgi:TonB-dependent starch-binding outer membrane protein SusC